MTDKIHRFIFDTYGVRGELVQLTDSCHSMLQSHNYPPFIASLLQQTAAVSVLLATTLKFEGKISIQLLSENSVKMLVVQTTHELEYRGLVRFDEAVDYNKISFNDITPKAQMSITIEPTKGNRYQGIVPLDGDSLAECVESYFKQSEQLDTRILLFNNAENTTGLLLQALPDMPNKESFEHLTMLASTLTEQESLTLTSDILLNRLFHNESVKYFEPHNVQFKCTCSKAKMLDSLSLLTEEEIVDSFSENPEISVKCEFCLSEFLFNEIDVKTRKSIQGNNTKH